MSIQYPILPIPVHPRIKIYVEMIDWLMEVAAESARRAAASPKRRRPKRGFALLPGPDTPIWNELVKQVAPLLRKRGSKIHLARILGIPKQRLNVCLKSRKGCLDAERTLLLLAWLAARRQGRTLT